MSKPPTSPKKGRIWISVGALSLALVVAAVLLMPLGKLGPLGEMAQAYGKRGNTFSVSDPTGRAVAAELRLCGATQTLHRSNAGFSAEVPITCEGDGEVRLHFVDGQQASCVVGYVTPGAEQRFDFVVSGNKCV